MYLLFWPVKIIDIEHFQTIRSEYHPGDVFDYSLKYSKHIDLPGIVIRSFEDGIVYQLPSTRTQNPLGDHSVINASLKVPDCLPAGEYVMRMSVIYHVNAFRDITYSMKSNKFKVVEACK
jgi:hypothetical protein